MYDDGSTVRTGFLVKVLKFERRLRILDVGANPLVEGDVSYKGLLDQGYAEVVGFEPQEHALAALLERKSEAETYLPYALGAGQEKELHLFQSSGFTSVFPADAASARYLGFHQAMKETDRVQIQTRRMDEITEIGAVDFLKIDVQGSETEIISHGLKTLAGAVAVQSEVRFFPLYEGEPTYGELEQALAKGGFRFLKLASLKHVSAASKWRKRLRRTIYSQAVDGDGFYLRDMRRPEAYSDDQLKALAILADGIMDAPDVTLFALDHLIAREAIPESSAEAYLATLPSEWTK
ncbi:FkbM family methyltransferase [Donghicola mangrovi]|uniref:FkbM family methyltransferase n=1 Tax=Donghicola mangrovi TaxID=2729614 RepID=A0A850QD08_9RHOB|nr:FkbM family methyltransferase [Donghicola mangrovi]NVO24049.1 FkbM family methyltransferase [Donghicola mangrovi]